MSIRVLINAGPWLPVPPDGYGGIENMVAALVPELRRQGVHVVLASVGASSLPVDELLAVYRWPQFDQLQRPYNRAMGVASAHMHLVARRLARGDIDLVHDHVEAVGPTVLSALSTMDDRMPPVLHTLHWDLAKHPELYSGFDGGPRLFVNGVSAAQLARAPAGLHAHSLGHVHLATPLAGRRLPVARRQDVVVLGRITPGKGQHIAARLAHRLRLDVVLAGPVGPYRSAAELAAGLAGDPDAASNPDVAYWRDRVRPLVDGRRVRWIGSVGAAARDELVAGARATLFPLRWEEPGGSAVVESLALGTPVIGYARGCLPELIDHGRTGLLAPPDNEHELGALLLAACELDPADCRQVAAERFTPRIMAAGYRRLYESALTGRAPAGRRRYALVHTRRPESAVR